MDIWPVIHDERQALAADLKGRTGEEWATPSMCGHLTVRDVLASVQSHTHFLDSPRIRESLSATDFHFEDLKAKSISVYLILPADRLETFGRWLRLLIQQALTVNARDIRTKPAKPAPSRATSSM